MHNNLTTRTYICLLIALITTPLLIVLLIIPAEGWRVTGMPLATAWAVTEGRGVTIGLMTCVVALGLWAYAAAYRKAQDLERTVP